MCNFWTAIVTKKGEILTDFSDSHDAIKKSNNLNDNCKLEDLEFYPVEILPKDNKTIFDEPNKENWIFNIGASGGHHSETPEWWKKSFENKCWKQFESDWKNRVLKDCEIEELNNKKGLFLKNCKIKII